VPEQLVKVPALGVVLPLDDGHVFLRRDGPLGLAHRLGPLQARDDRFQQPFHAQRMIVNPPQIDIGGHLAVGQHPVEMFRAGFADRQMADAVKVFVFDGDVPAPARFILFLGDDVFHHVLPCPRGQLGISAI